MKTKMLIKNQKGVAVVEFAIVLSLLVLLGMGICEFGLAWYNKQVIINASREGARAGIVQDPSDFKLDSEVQNIVVQYCAQRLIDFGGNTVDANDVTLIPNDDRAGSVFGDDFIVQVTYNHSLLVPAILHQPINKILSGRTLMKMEQMPS